MSNNSNSNTDLELDLINLSPPGPLIRQIAAPTDENDFMPLAQDEDPFLNEPQNEEYIAQFPFLEQFLNEPQQNQDIQELPFLEQLLNNQNIPVVMSPDQIQQDEDLYVSNNSSNIAFTDESSEDEEY